MAQENETVQSGTPPKPARDASIRRRPRVTFLRSIFLAVIFSVLTTPLIHASGWLFQNESFEQQQPSPITLRSWHFWGSERSAVIAPILVSRGDILTEEDVASVHSHLDKRRLSPAGWGVWFGGLALFTFLLSIQFSRTHRGRLMRTQLTVFGIVFAFLVFSQILLLGTSIASLALPVVLFAMMGTLSMGVVSGIMLSTFVTLLVCSLFPFDVGLLGIFLAQNIVTALLLSDRPEKDSRVALAGLGGAMAGVIVYAALSQLLGFQFSPQLSWWQRPIMAPLLAGGIASTMTLLFRGTFQTLLGDVSKATLLALEDLSNPLLKQIAEQSPGTWQHSLAMANMAEIATNAIGGNGRLVRVGAYYHDLGKSLQPKYFIENLQNGESSPHDQLDPDVSADAIFAHVTEGVREGRKAGLPERIIDFMHMHHGNGVLVYFWDKAQKSGNPKKLTKEDFRYPGLPPQTRETAVLAIVDAAEAASRTLREADEVSIKRLVRRIVYGKLDVGQLDESGLTMADLRTITDSLCETIKHAHHGRIEYPWQKKEAEEKAKQEAIANQKTTDSMSAPPLDSLDAKPTTPASQSMAKTTSLKGSNPRSTQDATARWAEALRKAAKKNQNDSQS